MRKALIILMVLFGLFLATGCVGDESGTPGEEEATDTQSVTETTGAKEFTLEELAKYNGENETIYVAYQGNVYDVSSDSNLWINGNHEGCNAGRDITEEMDRTPHGAEILKNYPVVGVLKE